jgi:predicted amidophosphoribosyltransferase
MSYKNPLTEVNCPFCGEEMASDAKFCPTCGAKLKEAVEEQKTKICSACGYQIPLDAKYCYKCGVKL